MPDIRSFFTPRGGAAPKPAPAKSEEPPKGKRTKGRKVVEDSDDDEIVGQANPAAKGVSKKKKDLEPKGVAISTDDYFASTKDSKKPKSNAPGKAEAKVQVKTEAPVRSSPRNKATRSYKKHNAHDDDAFMEDADEDGDDMAAAEVKGRSKRKNDDYEEEASEEETLPKPKRVASRGRPPAASTVSEEKKKSQASTSSKKRKSPEQESDEEEDLPRKKPAAAKPRAPRTKKADVPEDSGIQNILDSVATVRAPTPPPKDPNAKFDWRKAAAGGSNASAQPMQTADLPEGQEECLSGLSFVFTGVLQTIGRDEGQALVKRYGGKVVGQPSSKTSFVVLGEDAGPSKLAKIQSHGIKTIDEHGLFDLIRKLPAFGGSGKGAQKAQEKKKADEEKVKQQVAELEAEEKARKAKEAKAARKALLLTSKYAPTQLSHICGNKAQVEKIQAWLRNWPKSKKYNFQRRGADGMGGERAIIVSGPPGIGKTTAAHLAAKLEGYDVLESNASDARSKKLVEAGVSDVMNNTSLLGYFAGDGKAVDAAKKKLVLIMDEVDGMSAGDRGGVGALAKLCKKTEVPLILICNERRLPKMKPFDHVAFDVRFNRPTVDQVRSRIMTICHREGLKLPPAVVDALIEGSNKDIRQIINMISTAKLDQTSMSFDQGKAMTKAWEKHVVLKPWDICQKMLAGGLFLPTSKSTLNDKIELYFNDHEFSFLMIQENYLRTKPLALNGKGYTKREEKLKALELFDQAAESISDGDLVDRMIHGPQQHWSLMPTHAVFSTVRPASFIAGQLMGSNFTSWLGNFSKTSKLGRYVREIHSHMRLKSSGDHNEIRQQYMPVLWDQLVNRLQKEGTDGVGDVIELMDSYYLTREDFDAIKELGVGPMTEEEVSIETKTKAAFTRTYNSMNHPVPFIKASNVMVPKKQAKEAPDLEEAIEEEDDAEVVEPVEADDDEVDFTKDKYIKQPKAKKAAKKTGKAAPADNDDDKPKGRGKPKKGKK
ncbi:ATPase family associated with various cellular activities (AAA) domain-containing protein [Hirsutella rhossiliensis]|uniref:Replication factor C subunit 1 n=1 Tax=Hirsutella rhossiliensis TaxID=111463 RepID=A0A9P8SL19_9HYPO|nr:ATPase family associated with various cellular activities (AAA) domain-containing protein [Hirsutella rhossiliensis]KAH0967008.1 ATPase family associated with various cellular activities (AAA) domain-containing protein [Hirsutella rhossiliensis]